MPRIHKAKTAKRLTYKGRHKPFRLLNTKHEKRRTTDGTVKHLGEVPLENLSDTAASHTGAEVYATPWGNVQLTYSDYMDQLMVSTRQGDYGGVKGKKWTTYDKWAKVLGKHSDPKKVAQDILNAITDNPPPALTATYTDEEKRAAASLFLTISASEEYRLDGNRKFARAVLLMIIDGSITFEQAFTGADPIYTPAGTGGTDYMRQLYKDLRDPTADEETVVDYLSSSDEEG